MIPISKRNKHPDFFPCIFTIIKIDDFSFYRMRMIRNFFFILVLFLQQCKPDEQASSGTASLEFNPVYDNVAFEPVVAYDYTGRQKIKFSKFDFFITGVEFISSASVTNERAGRIDFTSGSLTAKKITLNGVKAGTYTGLRFYIGVKPDLNKKLPKDFDSSNPLSSSSHYWDSWNSYIFNKIEGVVDTAGNGKYDLGFAIHTGTDECISIYELNRPIQVTENENTSFVFDLDIKKLFIRGNGLFDIASSPLNHNPANIETLKSFSSRMPGAIQIKN